MKSVNSYRRLNSPQNNVIDHVSTLPAAEVGSKARVSEEPTAGSRFDG